MSTDTTQADGGQGPNVGRDASGRLTLIALCVVSALFFAGALAYAVGGGLLAGGGQDESADREERRLPREWANMIPLQPLGPELEAQAEEGDGSSEVDSASPGRDERQPSFAVGAPVPQGPPAGRPLAPPVRAPVPAAVPRPRLVRPIVRTILAPVPRLRDLSPIARDLPDTSGAPSLPGVPGDDVTIPDIDVHEIDPFPGPGGIEIPLIDPFPDGSPLPPIDRLPGGGGGLPLPGDTRGILLEGATGGSRTATVRSLGTEAGALDAGDSSFDPLVLAAADSPDDEGEAASPPSRLRGEESREEADDGMPRAQREAGDTLATRSTQAEDAPGKASRHTGRDTRGPERGDASARPARPDGGTAFDEGAPPACPGAEAPERRPDEAAGERAEPPCRAQAGEGTREADGGSEPPPKAGPLRPPLDGREPAGGSDDD